MTGQQPLLLIVDDEQGILDVISRFAERVGFEVAACSRGREAISIIQARRPDLVMVDLRMPEVGGLDILRAIRDVDAHCQAVLMTGYASVDTAVEAVKLGAMDYLTKPLDFGRLDQLLCGVRDEIERRRSVFSMEGDLARRLEFCGMIGRAPRMQDLFGMIRRLAPHVRLALITGETGTGKELVARALHSIGPRRDRRFVTVNCSAVTDTVFESELFGHVRGGQLGASENKPGLFEIADGGTLFLDEIAGLPLAAQAKLLRVLEMGEVSRLGALDARRVDVHVLAATNRDLRAEVAAGRFRGDLYYRLNIVEVKLPPLRDRREDISYLTAAFVREISERLEKPLRGLTPGAESLLIDCPWEGNVRELRNVIERACILTDGEFVTERELAVCLPPAVTMPGRSETASPATRTAGEPETDLLVNVERDHIQRALVRTGGNKKAAAQMLGLSRRALYRRLERLDLSGTISRRRQSALIGA
jgi:two-component system, NtrC family, response regulator HydG